MVFHFYAANICDPNPCQNQGVCQPSGNTYLCNCQDGFTGDNCESELQNHFIL